MILRTETDAMLDLARTAEAGRRWGDELLDALDAAVQATAWHGPEAEEFRARWEEVHLHARETFAAMEHGGKELLA